MFATLCHAVIRRCPPPRPLTTRCCSMLSAVNRFHPPRNSRFRSPQFANMSSSSDASKRKIRWGFIGCGKITHDFVNALSTALPDAELVACAARKLSDAEDLAKTFNIRRAYGSYKELCADAEVEVVYVGTIHPQHLEHASMALNAGKSVLCEKPMTVNEKDSRKLFDLAKEKKLFIMEAMWTRFQPAHAKARELIASGLIGEPSYVRATLGFDMDKDADRLWKNEQGGGALLDIGIYTVALAQQVFGEHGKKDPSKITCVGDISKDEKIDTHVSLTLQYGEGKMASLQCSFVAVQHNDAVISGPKGWIRLHDCFNSCQKVSYKLKDKEKITEFDFTEPPASGAKEYKFPDGQLMVHEARAVHEALRAGELESDVYPHADTLAVARILDEARRQLGVVYPQDKE